MSSYVEFKNDFSDLKSKYEAEKIKQLKMPELRELTAKLFNMLCNADHAIDDLIKGKDELVALRSSVDELTGLITTNKAATYSSVLASGKAETVKSIKHIDKQVLLIRPKEGTQPSAESKVEAETAARNALSAVPVVNFKRGGSDALVLELPNSGCKSDAKRALEECFPATSDFVVSVPRKMMPKMTLVGIPGDVDDEQLIDLIKNKNKKVSEIITNGGGSLSLVFSRTRQNERGEYKIAVLKMSPDIRNAFLEAGGYAYLQYSRCRIYDRFWVTQCFHCQKFGHIAASCPNNGDSPICGFCSGSHNGRNCTNKDSPCCTNCVSSSSGNTNHFASSEICPKFKLQHDRVIENTDLSSEKN